MSNLIKDNPELMKEWNYEKNKEFDLNKITFGSNKIVWWKCSNGHEWQSKINSRNKSKRCPYCSGRYPIVGETDLATTNPELAKEWNYEKNINLKPTDVKAGTNMKVWWKCSKGHEWQANIYSRNNGFGCPYCSGRYPIVGETDLATTNPKLAKEWNYEKNNNLCPNEISAGSAKKVWWKCSKGHEWQARISSRVDGNNCPYCSNQMVLKGYNDLATTNPELAKEWNYEKNGNLTPDKVIAGSDKKVWWKCSKGHEWQASIGNRNSGSNCHYCTNQRVLKGYNDLATVMPELLSEWNYEKNKNIKPTDVTFCSSKKVWWRCNKGHEWLSTIANKKNNRNCPICSSGLRVSFPEKTVLYYLKKYVTKNIYENYKDKMLNKMELDIYIPKMKIAVEYDGLKFHKDTKKDYTKNELCKQNEIKMIRFREKGLLPINGDYKTFWITPGDETDLEKNIRLLIELLTSKRKVVNINISKDRFDIYKLIEMSDKENSISVLRPELVKEWNYEKNGTLKPEGLTVYSNIKVWWKCSKGHEWEATINHRSSGTGCPYCNNLKILKGYNDIFTLYPNLKDEWNYEKNSITPYDYSAGSHKKVWWKCRKGHEYMAIIQDRTNGTGCPICAGKKVLKGYNDLLSKNPKLAKEWNYEKNKLIKPEEVTCGSNKKVWWKCSNGHEWQATINLRNQGTGCPICRKKK